MSVPRFLAFIGAGAQAAARGQVKSGFSHAVELDGGRVYTNFPASNGPTSKGAGNRISISAVQQSRPSDSVSQVGEWDESDRLGVHVTFEQRSNSIDVLRGRSGLMPCLVTNSGSTTIVASDIAAMQESGVGIQAVNLQVIADALAFPGISGRATGIADVFELFPGERLRIEEGKLEFSLDWSPFERLEEPIYNYDNAVAAVYLVIDDAFRMLSARIASVAVTLSGGLDSSIVGAMAAKHFQRTRFVNFYTDDPMGDEREYARALALHCGVELIELDITQDANTVRTTAGRHLPRPSARASGKAARTALLALAEKNGIDAILNGFGGDNVFCYLQSSTPLIDRLLLKPDFVGLAETARDITSLAGCSVPDLLKHSVRSLGRHVRNGGRYNWASQSRFLAGAATARMQPTFGHPWLNHARARNPGALSRVAMIARTHPFLEPFDRSAGVLAISPLLMGEVLDTCFRVPSWFWCRGGVNRAVARDAFSSMLPEKILRRRTKGSPVAAYAKTFSTNRDDLIDILAEGFLAQVGLIDRAVVSAFLKRPDAPFDSTFLHILSLADIECWCSEIART